MGMVNIWKTVVNYVKSIEVATQEFNMKKQHELIESIIAQLEALREHPLDDIDIMGLEDAHDAIMEIHESYH